jgi:hypothetical protein
MSDTTTNTNRPTREQMREASKRAKESRRFAYSTPANMNPGEKVNFQRSKTAYVKMADGSLRRIR